jgi:hypothetical protein
MMKTKTLITGMALTGALLMSASVVKANAYLELISGTSTVTIPAANFGPNGVGFDGTVGSWNLDLASGSSSGSLTVNLENQSANSSTQTAGLEIIYSSGSYGAAGNYTFGASSAGGNTLASTAQGYESSSLWTGVGSFGTSLGSALGVPAVSVSSSSEGGSISGLYYITEVMIIGNPAAGSISPARNEVAQVDASFRVTPVPDGGMTLTMAGSVFMGLAGLRSKFAAKRA